MNRTCLCLLIVAGCSGPGLPLHGYEPDPALTAVGTDPAMVQPVPEHPGLEAPVDQMLLMVGEGGTLADAERIAGDLGGEVVGAMAPIRVFQLRLPTTTMAELGSAIATAAADPAVAGAGYDFLVDWRSCPEVSDVSELEAPATCPWETNEFHAALTAFAEMEVEVSDIAVAVVDSGIHRTNEEFDDVTLANAHQPGGDPTGMQDGLGHGTRVAGVIAADDGDGGVNGIASRFLGDHLKVIWGFQRGSREEVVTATAGLALHSTLLAIRAGARVVNMSFGFGPFAAPTADETLVRRAFAELFGNRPDVLFVVAAANKAMELIGTNDAPAGIQAPNVITVGSSLPCQPTERAPESAYGERVEIVAQGESMTLVGRAEGWVTVVQSGTSFAAPQVTATAAILQAVEPSLSAVETRAYILGNARGGPGTTQGRALSVARPLLQLLLDGGSTFNEELDEDGDGGADRPGTVVARLCGGSAYEVGGFGSYTYEHASLDLESNGFLVTGHVLEAGFGMTLMRTGSDALAIVCEDCAFDLSDFALTEGMSGSVATFTRGAASAPTGGGVSISGTWTISECSIVDRFPDILSSDDTPMTVLVKSTIEGQMEANDGTMDEPVVVPFHGSFEVPLVAEPLASEHPLVQTLESRCDGGRSR